MDNKVNMLKLREVINRTALSRSTIYRKISEKTFPGSVSLSEKSVGWVEDEISQWINERIAERDQQAG